MCCASLIGIRSLLRRAIIRAVRLLTAAIVAGPATLLPATEAHMMMRPKRRRAIYATRQFCVFSLLFNFLLQPQCPKQQGGE